MRIIFTILFFVGACAALYWIGGQLKAAGLLPPCISASALMLAAGSVFAATAGKAK